MSDRYVRDSRLPYAEIQGEMVVVVPARREMHQFDEVATFLWAALQVPCTFEGLVEALCGEFDVEGPVATADVREFLKDLEGKGLVVRA